MGSSVINIVSEKGRATRVEVHEMKIYIKGITIDGLKFHSIMTVQL